jgi:predicted permease
VSEVIAIVLPTFIVIFIGYLTGKLSKINIAPIVDIALYIGLPALVFTSLLEKKIALVEAAKVWAAGALIVAGCGVTAWLVFKILRQKHSGLYVSIAAMNAVNIPFPVTYFAYGAEGLIAATLFSIPHAILMNSLGIYIMAGQHWRENVKEVLKLPPIYATCLGLIFNLLGVKVPDLITRSLDFIAMIALPLVLLTLGYNLSKIKMSSFPVTLLASFLRVGIGLAMGLLAVNVLNITGVFRSVVILVSAMPAAAMASIYATKYNNEADLVSSVVFLTTLSSIIIIPLLLHMLA